jgi:hypothetical protein
MRRGFLIVLLSLGVIGGFSSGFRHLAGRGGCHAGGHDRWGGYSSYRDGDSFDRERGERFERGPAPVAAPVQQTQQAPVYIIVPSAPASAPVIINGAPAAPAPANVVVIPSQAAPAAIPQPAPAAQ